MIIDVSKHNGIVDWGDLKGQIDGAIIRLGFRGYGSGVIAKDPQYDANKAGCETNGIPYSIYFFPASVNDTEAHEEAQFIINAAQTCHLSFPVFLDSEVAETKRYGGRADKLDKDTRTHLLQVIQADVKAAGYECGVYASESWFNTCLNSAELGLLWVAKYGSNDGATHTPPNVQGSPILWQYTSNASVGNLRRTDASIGVNGYQISAPVSAQAPVSTPPPVDTRKQLIALGQAHANNFAQCGLDTDGIRGSHTKEGAVKVLQRAINVDYGARIPENGVFDDTVKRILKRHYAKRGETQYMVTALEILFLLKGIDSKGVECPGIFGEGLEDVVGVYQSAAGLAHDNIAGYDTFSSLVQ